MSQRQRSKITSIILFIMLSFNTIAQDNIIQTDGAEIKAKVLEVELSVIKYKRFDNIEGPTYSIEKSQVFMIQYENGTRDVFNKFSTTATDPFFVLKDSLDTRLKSYIFANGGMRIGVLPTTFQGANLSLSTIGFIFGLDIEVGNVYYFAPKKMPKNFGVGLNFTWLNIGYLFGNAPEIPAISPYTVSLGPQISFKPSPKAALDLYFKPGMSLAYINAVYKPVFVMDIGINFRYKHFMVGVAGAISPTLTDDYVYYDTIYKRTLKYIPHDYSHVRIRVGVTIFR